MLLEGAKGPTKDEIKAHLAKDVSVDEISKGYSKLLNSLNNEKALYELYTANKIYLQSNKSINRGFASSAEICFGSAPKLVDFEKNPEEIRKNANKYVEEQTKNNIKELLPKKSIDEQTRFIILNAIYFKAEWLIPFTDHSETFRGMFYHPEYDIPFTQFMRHEDHYRYKEDDVAKVLELPYKGNELSMYIILPHRREERKAKEGEDLELLENYFDNVDQGLKEEIVMVTIPKLKIGQIPDNEFLERNVLKEFPLKKLLQQMGMQEVFKETADLSGITDEKPLFLGDAFHKAYMEINEQGTEAAAATGLVGSSGGGGVSRPVFTADHPFLFLIKHKASNSILFAGRVANGNPNVARISAHQDDEWFIPPTRKV